MMKKFQFLFVALTLTSLNTNGQVTDVNDQKGHNTPISAVAYSGDLTQVITAADDEILVWDYELGHVKARLIAEQGTITSMALDEDRQILYTAGFDGSIKAWNLKTQSLAASVHSHAARVRKIVLSPDHSNLISGDDDGNVYIWQTPLLTLVHEIDELREFVRDIDVSPDGNSFAVASQDRRVSIWNIGSGELIQILEYDIPFKVRYSHSGEYLFIEYPQKMTVVETSTYSRIREFKINGRKLGFLTRGDSIKIIEKDYSLRSNELVYHNWNFIDNISDRATFMLDSSNLKFGYTLINTGGDVSFWSVNNGSLKALSYGNLSVLRSFGDTNNEPDKIAREGFITRKLRFKTRKYLTSGGKEYIKSARIGAHSPFSHQFLEALRSGGGDNGIMTTAELKGFVEVLKELPHFGSFGSDQPGSDFLFDVRPYGERKNYALVIGANDYEEYHKLESPVPDANAIAGELTSTFGFEVELLIEPSRVMILKAIEEFSKKNYSHDDELLIYFAGHGMYNDLTGEGYLVPVDGKIKDPAGSSWISYSQLGQLVDDIPCEHIFLVLDACYGNLR